MLRNWNYGPSCAVCCWALVPVSHISCNFEAAHSTFSYVNDRFQSRAREKNIKHAPIELVHGDFLKSSAVKVAISSAGLVYMNNPRFGPELNLKVLSQSFLTPTLLFVSWFDCFHQMNFARSCQKAANWCFPTCNESLDSSVLMIPQSDLLRQPRWHPAKTDLQ